MGVFAIDDFSAASPAAAPGAAIPRVVSLPQGLMTARDAYELAIGKVRVVAGAGRRAANGEARPAAQELGGLDRPLSGQTFTFMNGSQVLLPAIAAEATVVSFVVPPGRNGVVQIIANQFVGGGWTEGTGDLVWRIEVDGVAAQGFNGILASLGSLSNPGDFSTHPIRVRERQTVNLICRNVAVIVAGQVLLGMMRGYFYPLTQEGEAAWL